MPIKIAFIIYIALASISFNTQAGNNTKPVVGAVYSMTNAVEGNQVVVFNRHLDGTLSFSKAYPTGGRGGLANGGDEEQTEAALEDALGSQGSLILSKNNRWLLTVNAGSNDITVFEVMTRVANNEVDYQLERVIQTTGGNFPSGGSFPVSLAISEDYLYVLNAGGQGNITGFRFNHDSGQLTPIDNSTRNLNANSSNPPFFATSPAQIGFDQNEDRLIVTIKGLNQVQLFDLDDEGRPSQQAITTNSSGSTPFGFTVTRRNRLLIAEAFGAGSPGDLNVGAVSSYKPNAYQYYSYPNKAFNPVSSSIPNQQALSCWITLDRLNRYAFVSNNGSGTISTYYVKRNGKVTIANQTAATGLENPVDLTMDKFSRYLYVVNAANGSISAYSVRRSKLNPLGTFENGLSISGGAVGIAVQ
ncbi:beta-propeller fold lactonase family protein [Endozoicomonas sp. SM1973]|uniref:Beta-propeller fold lactonase family protein n=1 Tax=Spartinivicinus marinus TaxID=2994442 RepID=A0A853IGM5_9GAMM|nr:beta-propeller fold lactonase family protein [Spartinivicinus marinus]MCX4025683.1 beta-propeller fold lactonase family protein [Spartinivicinus marinus]NYZ68295.1 beta-propeller fold lactonase family protein [Spartinivicinus marinus]